MAYLQSRGLHAFERDWAMGETIGVVAGPMETDVGITVYRRAVYIAPHDEGWIVEEIRGGPPVVNESEVMSLESACARAETILSAVRSTT